MANFSFSGFGFSSISAKTTLSFLLGIAVACVGISALRTWWQPNRALPQAVVAAAPTPAPEAAAPVLHTPQQQRLVQNEEANSAEEELTFPPVEAAQIIEEKDPLEGVVFMVSQDGKKKQFNDWQKAHKFLKKVKPLVQSDSDSDSEESSEEETQYALKLSVEFDSSLITSHLNEQEFRIWLSYVGAYVFSRRIDLMSDLGPVLRNTQGLIIEKSQNLHKRGCARFKNNNGKWTVTIKGLENHPNELKKLLKHILVEALKNPASMAKLNEIQVRDLSQALESHELTITQDQKYLVDEFIMSSTLGSKMKGIKDNRAALMPLIFLNNDNQHGYKFFNDFYEQIVVQHFKGLPGTEKSLEKILDKGKAYDAFITLLINWREESQIEDLILGHLFSKGNN